MTTVKLPRNQRYKDLLLAAFANGDLDDIGYIKFKRYLVKKDKEMAVIKKENPSHYKARLDNHVKNWFYNNSKAGKASQAEYRGTAKGKASQANNAKQWAANNPEKILDAAAKYRDVNPEKVKQSYKKWEQSPSGVALRKSKERIALETKRTRKNKRTLEGHLNYLYSKTSARYKTQKGKPLPYTRQQFKDRFYKQTYTYGLLCPYTFTEMTWKHSGKRKVGTGCPTNISVDRYESNKDYSKLDNLYFVTIKANLQKGECNPKLMWRILNVKKF